MFTLSDILLLLFVLLSVLTESRLDSQALVSATLVNITIDDTYGDESNGKQITYSSEDPKSPWHLGQSCTGCAVHLDPTHVYDGTWHDSTHEAESEELLTATVGFEGVSIYVFCTVVTRSGLASFGLGSFDMTFLIDGSEVGQYTQPPDEDGLYVYNVPVFVQKGLPAGMHQLTIVNGRAGGPQSLALLDYIIYTHDAPTEAGTTTSISSSTSRTSSAKPSSSQVSTSSNRSLSQLSAIPSSEAPHTSSADTNLPSSSLPGTVSSGAVIRMSTTLSSGTSLGSSTGITTTVSSESGDSTTDHSTPPSIQRPTLVVVIVSVCGALALAAGGFALAYCRLRKRYQRFSTLPRGVGVAPQAQPLTRGTNASLVGHLHHIPVSTNGGYRDLHIPQLPPTLPASAHDPLLDMDPHQHRETITKSQIDRCHSTVLDSSTLPTQTRSLPALLLDERAHNLEDDRHDGSRGLSTTSAGTFFDWISTYTSDATGTSRPPSYHEET
ncbi:hypothetical protein GY45DRAFT_695812 [Cubamyces sp. BRFM 1775]|nr:hypothetical protein GY45DRAFT_695812 [Cubamyces sp. BRFM 1775]